MNLECPSCHAAYLVPGRRLGSRRVVRCGACGHEWTVVDEPELAPADTPAAAVETTPAPAGPEPPEGAAIVALGEAPAPPPPATPRSPLLVGAWVASLLLIVGVGSAVYAWRSEVVRAWPPAGRILSAGLVAAPDPHADPRG
ncbi:MAG TPA: MJ0042-type zinc finger domain-containing protein [Rhodopila sp.]|uniref:MJ0042-type zinc finger domain-containing protein n=1 Tax=Rhodopila sp. TaxID=2480087 RepID=UPI002BC7197C|nr:MJ0042-type zinc finger domain-containing protein [Rhodopila sp.]HVY17218.1 MJ0042-type zinc finger domain-containing protein [Rhodopila sp.]